MLSPVILFVYNRPEHTRKTLESLSKNTLAGQTILYVFCDGLKKGASQEEKRKIKEVRSIVKSKNWCKQVIVHREKANKGLADSIIDGVTRVINKHGRVIVLEDDLIISRGFLQYMNDALNTYSTSDRVMHISAYQYPIKQDLPATFFFTHISSWGWATWKKSWDELETNTALLLDSLRKRKLLSKFDLNGAYPFSSHLEMNTSGELYTWAIKWLATVYLRDGLVLYPGKSLVKNIGFDDSGMNSGSETSYNVKTQADRIPVRKIKEEINLKAAKAIEEFFSWRKVELKKIASNSNKPKLLNLGCGPKYHKDWVNIDYLPIDDNVIQHNLLEGVPFEDNTFNAVYHSHVLEHFSKEDGTRFIKECYRVLKPGGIIRIAVPDLERIAQEYLKALKDARANKPNADINYEWMMLELYDQTVRNNSGGEMARFFYRPDFKNEDFVYGRVGSEARAIREGYLQSLKPKRHKSESNTNSAKHSKLVDKLSVTGIKQHIKHRALQSKQKYIDIGEFRLGGEIHQWMYDSFSLGALLRTSGFKNVRTTSSTKSFIPNWTTYELDYKNGETLKPESLFIEAQK